MDMKMGRRDQRVHREGKREISSLHGILGVDSIPGHAP
jgi:hypothetical protein